MINSVAGRAFRASEVLINALANSKCSVRSISRISWRGALIGPTSDDKHFARLLNLKESAAMLTEKGFLWSAAVADATTLGLSPEAYLSRVDEHVRSFLRRDVLHDREATLSDIREVWRGEGQLGLVLGGKSVGKSFLLRMLAEQENDACRAHLRFRAATSMRGGQLLDSAVAVCPRRVIVYDAREAGADLSRGLVSVLKGDPPFFQRFKQAFKVVVERGAAAAVTAAASGSPLARHASELGTAAGKVASDVLDVFLDDRPLPLNQVLAAYILSCKEADNYPCLVIDEANVALAAESTAARDHSLEALHLLAEHTKQLRLMNVILAASEHSEPFRLNALGFKSDHWTFTLVVGEVGNTKHGYQMANFSACRLTLVGSHELQIPPKAMRELLINTWGLGNHMADAVMSVWGGESVLQSRFALQPWRDRQASILAILPLHCRARMGGG